MFKKAYFFLMIVSNMLSWKIVFGLSALILAWILVKQTKIIFKFNAWMRDYVFSDRVVLFSGKRMAILLLILGAISIFSGVEHISRNQALKPKIAAKIYSQAQNEFMAGNYDKAVQRCGELLRSDPSNLPTWELLATAHYSLGNKDLARGIVAKILEINPKYPIDKGILAKVFNSKQRKKK